MFGAYKELLLLLVIGTGVADELDWESAYTGELIDLRRDLVVAGPSLATAK